MLTIFPFLKFFIFSESSWRENSSIIWKPREGRKGWEFCYGCVYVAEPPELSRLKCASHHPKGNTSSNALQTEQFLVCRVTSRYNHRFSDRTSIPRTKASPEILQPQFYNTGKVVITTSSRH